MSYKKLFLYTISAVFMSQGVGAASTEERPSGGAGSSAASRDGRFVVDIRLCDFVGNVLGRRTTSCELPSGEPNTLNVLSHTDLSNEITASLRDTFAQFTTAATKWIPSLAQATAYNIGGKLDNPADALLHELAQIPETNINPLESSKAYLFLHIIKNAMEHALSKEEIGRLKMQLDRTTTKGQLPQYLLDPLVLNYRAMCDNLCASTVCDTPSLQAQDIQGLIKPFVSAGIKAYKAKSTTFVRDLLASYLANLTDDSQLQSILQHITRGNLVEGGLLAEAVKEHKRKATVAPPSPEITDPRLSKASPAQLRAALAAAEAAEAAAAASGGSASSTSAEDPAASAAATSASTAGGSASSSSAEDPAPKE